MDEQITVTKAAGVIKAAGGDFLVNTKLRTVFFRFEKPGSEEASEEASDQDPFDQDVSEAEKLLSHVALALCHRNREMVCDLLQKLAPLVQPYATEDGESIVATAMLLREFQMWMMENGHLPSE